MDRTEKLTFIECSVVIKRRLSLINLRLNKSSPIKE